MSNEVNLQLYVAGSHLAKLWSDGSEESAAERIGDILNDDGEAWDLLLADDAYTPAERLYFVIAGIGDGDRDRDDSAEFWQSVCDDPQPEIDFLGGFATGLYLNFNSALAD